MKRLRVYWKGAFYTSASLAIVNRRLVRALIERGNVDVSIGTDPLANEVLPLQFRALSERTSFGADEADVTVLHEWPPRFAAPSSTRYVHVQPWEYGSMPTEWFDALHDDCDEIWVHSEYNRAAYIEAGISPARIAVIPHGFDPLIFNPDGPKMAVADDRFRFLFVGGTVPRKGIDVLVNAYTTAFRPYDNVSLVIKDADASFYRNQTRSQELRALAARRDIPRIEYIDQTVPDEAMAQIFRGCDTFVLPYRGEGFGLPVLEAMACGLAPIVTFGGATDDLVDTEVGWRIPSLRVELDPAVVPFPTITPPWILEPDQEALQTLLRNVYEHRDEARSRGAAAARRTRDTWTWDRAAQKVEERLHAIMQLDALTPRRRHIRYADTSKHAEPIFGSSDLGGITVELFRRLGTVGQFFVETARQDSSLASVLERGFAWKGITLHNSAPETICDEIADRGAPPELDLLSLHSENAQVLFTALGTYRARVVACTTETGFSGYVCVANGLFVRKDLATRAGFQLSSEAQDLHMLGVPVPDLRG